MRTSLVATIAAITLTGTWAALAAQPDGQPAARAYLSYGFGAPARTREAPLHFGLRMDYDQGVQPFGLSVRPPLMQFDFDSRGNRIASAGGLPFAARLVGPMRQNEGDAPAAGGGSGDSTFSYFDWGLLALGLGGTGALIYEVTKGKDDPNPPASTTGGSNSGGLLGGLLGGVVGYADRAGQWPVGDRELDGGNGSMGDLIPQR
jgi:hypothetical protein